MNVCAATPVGIQALSLDNLIPLPAIVICHPEELAYITTKAHGNELESYPT